MHGRDLSHNVALEPNYYLYFSASSSGKSTSSGSWACRVRWPMTAIRAPYRSMLLWVGESRRPAPYFQRRGAPIGQPNSRISRARQSPPSRYFFRRSAQLVLAIRPLVPRLRNSPVASGFLDGVDAAALGLMLSVCVTLGRSTLIACRLVDHFCLRRRGHHEMEFSRCMDCCWCSNCRMAFFDNRNNVRERIG